MCNIRIYMHPKSGCNLIKLILSYCALCPYISKRPTSSFSMSKSISSDYQVYWFSHYLDLSILKKNKKWRARLAKCPGWEGANYVENKEEDCPAGSACQRDKDRRAKLIFDNGKLRGKGKKSGNLTRGAKEVEIDVVDLMDEMARLEKSFDVEAEKRLGLRLERDSGLERLRRDENEMEKAYEEVLGALAGLEAASRGRNDDRKAWWNKSCEELCAKA